MREIADIRADCEAATPGPWDVGLGCYDVYSVSCDVTVAEGDVDEDINPEEVGPNAEFIAHSRQDVLDMLAMLEANIPDIILAALAEKDKTIRLLNIDLELKDRQAEIVLRDNQLCLAEKDAEIKDLKDAPRALIDAIVEAIQKWEECNEIN